MALGLAVFTARESGGVGNPVERLLGLILAPGQHQRTDRTIDNALPEPAAQREFRKARVNGFAEAADEGGKIADARRQYGFDLLAHAPRHHGRSAAGADGDDDIAAINDGRKDER